MPQISSEEFLNLYRAGDRNFRRVQLEEKAELQGVTLCEVDLTYASLLRVNLCQADLHGSKLIRAVLIQANLSEADLRTADLSRANLCEANLQGANLCEANLQGVNLCEANLQDALYNQQTQFPKDFDPSLAGMSLMSLYVEQPQPPSPKSTPLPTAQPSPKSTPPSTPQATRFLRLLRKGDSKGDQLYPLFSTKEVFIGRDPHCKIVLDSRLYSNVSRRHAALRPFFSEPGVITWEIWDLNSANGTYVNGQRIKENQCLQVGDRITLGHDGPKFIFLSKGDLNSSELNQSQPNRPQSPKLSQPKPPDSVNLTQLFPIISMGRDLPEKAYLLPMIITVIFVVLMFTKVGDPDPTDFNRILGIYLGGVSYYFAYQLCGRCKPWWVLLSMALATILILNSPLWSVFVLVFRQILPGDVPDSSKSVGFFSLLIGHFFGAGLMEELLKALPVLGAYFLGRILPTPWQKRIGVCDPLDGILMGMASALGFTLVETLGQYVPEVMNSFGSRAGWQLLIPRMLGSVVCHMAYSGYLGYCIGLSILKTARRWQILVVGYLTVSILHALWNATASLNVWFLAVVGIVSYAFLAAAILKARSLSCS